MFLTAKATTISFRYMTLTHASIVPEPPEVAVMTDKPSTRWWLRTDSAEIVIAAPPQHVYDLISNLPRMGEWSPECAAVEWTGDSSGPEVGATFVGHNVGGPFGLLKWSRPAKHSHLRQGTAVRTHRDGASDWPGPNRRTFRAFDP